MAISHAVVQRTTPNRQAAADVQIDVVEPSAMWVDRRYRASLERAGLASFEAVMRSTGGRLLRALPHRENWRLDLADSRGTHGAYLKKHHTRYWWDWLRARLGMGPGATAGRVEAMNIARLERDGIAVMRLVAFGERLHGDGLLESFLMTEELAGFTQLDHFLRERFPPRDARRATVRDADFDALTRAVAQVAGAFHRAGYNHRDLYCCHFFIREARPGAFEVRLIDLQRVEEKRLFRSRWLVKDLAQMAYSAPRDRVGCRQQLAFMKRYFGVAKLEPEHKRIVRRIIAKRRSMERRLGTHP